MKKLLTFLVLTVSLSVNSQHFIKGVMASPGKDSWMMLSSLEGTSRKYIQKIDLKEDVVKIKGKDQTIARFDFKLPSEIKPGMYRLTYRTGGNGYIDVIYNNENIQLTFDANAPEETVYFEKSEENKSYNEFLYAYAQAQNKVDEAQIKYLRTKSEATKEEYKKANAEVKNIINNYKKKTKGMLAYEFIKASVRHVPEEPLKETNDYLKSAVDGFYKNIDFENKVLYKSSFLIDRIVDYVFFLNVSESPELQNKLHKESIDKTMKIIKPGKFKKQALEFLITQFTANKNPEITDYIFDKHYGKLPTNLQDNNFKTSKLNLLKASIGRIAPDFSWKEGSKNFSLSTIADGEKYLLIFWSTQCPHCVKEVPKVYKFMKDKKNVSVIALAIEDNDVDFKPWASDKLKGWHNVLLTHPEYRFENQTIKDYVIEATPSYFVLDKTKKIIALPNAINDIKAFFSSK